MLVREVYEDCFHFNESTLAHCIYHLIEEEKITLDDDMAKVDFKQVDNQKVSTMIQNNLLGINKFGIFSLKMNQKEFVFIFANSKQEAIQFYHDTFYTYPLNCHEYTLDYQLARGNKVISFREMRKDFENIPAIAGFFEKENF
ncbi:hypothetical protein [Neobacillus niacini]|uniref:hypothetical protein n=1 Tax=Neobacillus niacini TaxID=86668 RepID=UPI002FFFB5DE